MGKRTVLMVTMLVAAVCVVAVLRSRGRHNVFVPPPPPLDHSNPVVALYDPAEGKTTCETVYNGYAGYVEARQKMGRSGAHMPLATIEVAPRPQFMAACEALSPDMQRCLLTKYARSHGEECKRVMGTGQANPLVGVLTFKAR